MIRDECKIIVIETGESSCFEDKYGYYAILEQLNDLYRCPCGQFYVFKEGDHSKMVCPDCGKEVDTPKKE